MRLAHRGPDATNYVVRGTHFLGCHRLAIINTSDDGNQPLHMDGNHLICNGQLYNYTKLVQDHAVRSDVDVILYLMKNKSVYDIVEMLDGDFAFVVVQKDGTVCMARDPVGVRPLFYGVNENGDVVCAASEVKSLIDMPGVKECHVFPPGHIYDSSTNTFHKYSALYPGDTNIDECSYNDAVQSVKGQLTNAIYKRVNNADRPVAFLCSGGIDSSIVVSVAHTMLKEVGREQDVHMFSIEYQHPGSRSDDTFYASMLASQLGVNHTIVKFTWEDVVGNIKHIVRQIESYDPNTIRASIPMYFLAKHISEKTNYKVILSGEGADEVFMGYNIFAQASDPQLANKETQRLVGNLHMFDVLRADRTFAAHGIELRVPFLDKDFLHDVFRISGVHKMYKNGVEKKLLRDAFVHIPQLAHTRILDRGKERFSDGCGFGYVPCLLNHWIAHDENARRDLATKTTAESKAYAGMFDEYYPDHMHLIAQRTNPGWCAAQNGSILSIDV